MPHRVVTLTNDRRPAQHVVATDRSVTPAYHRTQAVPKPVQRSLAGEAGKRHAALLLPLGGYSVHVVHAPVPDANCRRLAYWRPSRYSGSDESGDRSPASAADTAAIDRPEADSRFGAAYMRVPADAQPKAASWAANHTDARTSVVDTNPDVPKTDSPKFAPRDRTVPTRHSIPAASYAARGNANRADKAVLPYGSGRFVSMLIGDSTRLLSLVAVVQRKGHWPWASWRKPKPWFVPVA